MKKRFSYCLLFVFSAIGCETEKALFYGPYFVRFTEENITYKESHRQPISIEIHSAGPVLPEDIEIAYQISGDAREGIDYVILGTRERMTIPAGEYFGSIQIQLINNANNILRSQDIIFTLQTVDTGERQIGQGVSGIGSKFTITILDDCILGGDYTGSNGGTMEGISITSSDCENYTVSNWNVFVFNVGAVMTLTFVDNGDNTLTIPEQEVESLPTSLATIDGTGVVDPTTHEIVLTVQLLDFDGQPEATITYIPE